MLEPTLLKVKFALYSPKVSTFDVSKDQLLAFQLSMKLIQFFGNGFQGLHRGLSLSTRLIFVIN